MDVTWNLWHGCKKKSEGCKNCYVYRIDKKYNKDASNVVKTCNFDLPIKKDRQKNYKIPSGTLVYTCFSSDFLVEEADIWREDAWKIIKERSDLKFFFLTKRPERFYVALPKDWNNGYEHVAVGVSCENQRRADERLSVFKDLPIHHKYIALAPMIGNINIEKYLDDTIELVTCDGESGIETRPLEYEWVLNVREQCIRKHVNFMFRQTGARLIKDGKIYYVQKKYQHIQARKANINIMSGYHFI